MGSWYRKIFRFTKHRPSMLSVTTGNHTMKMYMYSYLYIILIQTTICICQDITWTWLSGSTSANTVEGQVNPGGRSGAAYWHEQDQQAMWVFGGEHHVDHAQPGLKNDLWKLDLTSNQWTLVHNGSASSITAVPERRQLAAGCGVQGAFFILYGGLGDGEKVLSDTWVFYISDNLWYTLEEIRVKLGARNQTDSQLTGRGDAAVWCQSDYNLTVFGGFDVDHRMLHDMWIFDMETLAWREAEHSAKIPADSDYVNHLWYPSGRSGATTWITDGLLYLFGGNIQHKNVRSKHLITGNTGDMWMYDTEAGRWQYLTGTRQPCLKAGIYGDLGVPSEDNQPGCRRRAAAWTDTKNNLWMFGGDGIDDSQSSVSVFKHSKLLSDIWHFNTLTNEWSWKGGLSAGDGKGKYGSIGQADKDNLPGSRCESVIWAMDNELFLFGGVGHDSGMRDGYLDDVWKLDVCFDYTIMTSVPYAGTVFALIIAGLLLVTIIFIGFMCNRDYYGETTHRNLRQNVKYEPLSMESVH